MNRVQLLLVLLLAIWLTLGAAFWDRDGRVASGRAHPEFEAILQGSPAPPSTFLMVTAGAFGVLQIAVFVTCMTIGISRGDVSAEQGAGQPRSSGWLAALFGIGMLFSVGAFTQMMLADRAATLSGKVTYLGPFPAATSWMLFGLGLAPLVFIAAYVFGFSRWILTDEDLARFDALVASHRQKSEAPSHPH